VPADRALLGVAVGSLLLGGCAFTLDQRVTEGPEATRIWQLRAAQAIGRSPSFDETLSFEDQLDRRVRAYLDRHPAVVGSPRGPNLRFWRRVSVGMTKEEVLLLLDRPDLTTTDPARMEAAARRFWPEVRKRAKELWSYPDGWSLYFDGDELAEVTVYRRQFLED